MLYNQGEHWLPLAFGFCWQTNPTRFTSAHIILAKLQLLIFLISFGYSYTWTGFGKYTPTNAAEIPSKTLWDWMQLLIIPVVLAIGAFLLQRSERAIERETANKRAELEREIAKDRQQEAALQAYLDRMSELLLKEKLRTTKKAEVRDVARTRTISIMRVLNVERNNLVLQFLREAKLITDENSIFNGADMEGMGLQSLSLDYVFLQRAILSKVNLAGAYLRDANLEQASLRDANLKRTILTNANLHRANLDGVNLGWAFFGGGNGH